MFVAVDAYDRFVGRYSAALARELIAFAGVKPGARALDVGCGPGGLTAELAQVTKSVAAVDPSPPFVEACAKRVPSADVRVAPAEDLPFEDDTFDVALAQLVVNFMRDPVQGVGEMGRVAGTVAAAVWDYAGEMTLLRRFWDAATALDPAAHEHDEGRSTRFAPTGLEALFTRAGLNDVTTTGATVAAHYEDFEDLWEPLEQGIGPAGAWAASRDPDARVALKAEYRRRLTIPEGPFALTARAWLVRGVRTLT